jgi:uncharacterized protein YbcI
MAESQSSPDELEGIHIEDTDVREGADNGSRQLVEISNEMVRIYKDQFGRGPTKVRTNYAGPDTLVCLLEHTFTPAERNLQAMGEHQRLRDIRSVFQYAESSRFTAPIERITGRRVRGFLSGMDTNTDIACELFVLEPEATNHRDRQH